MIPNTLLHAIVTMVRQTPTAALTTTGPDGLRARLVHPLWEDDGRSGVVLTDGASPKAQDLLRSDRVTLTYGDTHDGTNQWLLVAATTAVDDGVDRVTAATADCTSRPDGYQPSDFWTAEEMKRLVVVEFRPTVLEMARFEDHHLEVQRWQAPSERASSS